MGAPMRYALTVASALACWSGGAFAAEMPKELTGQLVLRPFQRKIYPVRGWRSCH